MSTLASWLGTAWNDFLALKPTEQATFAIAGLTFGFALLAGLWKGYRAVFPKEIAPPQHDLSVILKLLETGAISSQDAITLSGSIAASAVEEPKTPEASSDALLPLVEEDEGRREFSQLVRELATSNDNDDREVILKYAKGDRFSALATLVAKAEAAGAKGAGKWREVAIFATPFDHEQAVDALQKATQIDPKDAVSFCRLSRLLAMDEDYDGALAAAEKALAVAPGDSIRGRALMRKGLAKSGLGDTEAAGKIVDEAVEAAQKGAAADPSDDEKGRTLANAYEAQSAIKLDLGSPIEAAAALDKAIALYDTLLKFRPEDEDLLLERLRAMGQQAYLLRISDDPEGSCTAYQALISEIDETLNLKPDNRLILQQKSLGLLQWAFSLDGLSDDTAALEKVKSAEWSIRDLIPIAVRPASVQNLLMWAQILQSRILTRQGKIEEAVEIQEQALVQAREAAKSGTSEAKRVLFVALTAVGELQSELGNNLAAEDNLTEAQDIALARAAEDLADVSKQEDALSALWKLAEFYSNQGDHNEQHRLAAQALSKTEQLAAAYPAKRQLRSSLAHALAVMSEAHGKRAEAGDQERALDHSERAHTLSRELARLNPKDFATAFKAMDLERFHAAYLTQTGQYEAGFKMANAALGKCISLGTTPDRTARLAVAKSRCHFAVADAYHAKNDFERALHHRAEAVAILRERYEAGQSIRSRRKDYFVALVNYGDVLFDGSRSLDAKEQYDLAFSLIDTAQNHPNRADQKNRLVVTSKLQSVATRLGKLEEARRLSAEVLAMCEAQAENLDDLLAQSNLAKAYLSEVQEAMNQDRTADAKDWLSRAEQIMPRLSKIPKMASTIEASVMRYQLWICVQEHDLPRAGDLIDQLVERKQKELDAHWSQSEHLALYDLRLRQVSIHFKFGAEDPHLADLHRSLDEERAALEGKELSRAAVASLWQKLGHAYLARHLYRQAAEAFTKSIALLNPDDDAGQLQAVTISHLSIARALLGMDDVANTQSELEHVAHLTTALRERLDEPRYALEYEDRIARTRAKSLILEGRFDDARAEVDAAHAANRERVALQRDASQPHYDRFDGLSILLDIETARSDANAMEDLLGQMRDVGGKAVALSHQQDLPKRNLDCYFAIHDVLLNLEKGKPGQALAAALEHEDMLRKATMEPTSMLQPELLANFLIATTEAATAAGDLGVATTFGNEAVEKCATLTAMAPDARYYGRLHLRALYHQAVRSEAPDCFALARDLSRSLQATGSLPPHFPWIAKILKDPRFGP